MALPAGAYIGTPITKAEVLGSPFVMLESAKEAEFLINHERRKKVRFDLAYFFIEADKTATQVLRQELTNRDYGSLFDQSIFVKSGRFQDHVTDIIGYAKSEVNVQRAPSSSSINTDTPKFQPTSFARFSQASRGQKSF
jgi:hypothetical protein